MVTFGGYAPSQKVDPPTGYSNAQPKWVSLAQVFTWGNPLNGTTASPARRAYGRTNGLP